MSRHVNVLGLALAASLALAACGAAATQQPPAAISPVPPANAATQAPAGGAATAPAGDPSNAPAPAPAAAGPIDACALLTADEVATLVADATAEPSTSDGAPIPSFTCTWNAAVSDAMIPVSLAVTATPGFVSGSGATPDFVKAMIEAEGSNAENNGRVVDGLGDAASVTSIVKFDATAQFLQGDTLAQLVLTAEGAPGKQDAVVELAKLVKGRLP